MQEIGGQHHHYFEKGKVFDFVDNPNNYKTEECDLLIIGGGVF